MSPGCGLPDRGRISRGENSLSPVRPHPKTYRFPAFGGLCLALSAGSGGGFAPTTLQYSSASAGRRRCPRLLGGPVKGLENIYIQNIPHRELFVNASRRFFSRFFSLSGSAKTTRLPPGNSGGLYLLSGRRARTAPFSTRETFPRQTTLKRAPAGKTTSGSGPPSQRQLASTARA